MKFNKEIIQSFKDIKNSGIAFSINLIIGFPSETRELVMETVELIKHIHGYDTITVSIFTPYRGTILQKMAVKNGWLDKNNVTIHTTSSSVLKMPKPYLSSLDIDGLMRVMPLYVYFPKSEWKNIKRAETNDYEGNQILEHYSSIYKENFLGINQDERKKFISQSGTGCKSNPKDSYQFVMSKSNNKKSVELSDFEIQMLTMN